MKKEETSAITAFESSVQFKGERYAVDMPWKPNIPKLPNNYEMAVSWLAQVVEHWTAVQEVAGSNLGRTNTQGL